MIIEFFVVVFFDKGRIEESILLQKKKIQFKKTIQNHIKLESAQTHVLKHYFGK